MRTVRNQKERAGGDDCGDRYRHEEHPHHGEHLADRSMKIA
jgi:hypothetical protein